jgi:hypothetical protein
MTRAALQALTLTLLAGVAQASPSSYSEQGGGAKVLYLFLQDLGYQTARVFSVDEVDPKTEVLVVLGGAEGREGRRVLDWLRTGRTLVLAPPLVTDEGICATFTFGTLTLPRRGHVVFDKSGKKHPELNLRESACTMTAPATATMLAGERERALVFEHVADRGRMLVLAHEDMLVNNNLDGDDIAVLLRRWLSAHVTPGARVTFLEGRQGGELLEMVKRANLTALLLHGLVFLLLLYWCVVPRFGDPRPVDLTTRRAFAQHARGLGHLYQHRGASAYLLKQQYERFLARILGHTAGAQAAGVSLREARQNRGKLAKLISTRTGRDADSVESTLAQVEYIVGATDVVDPKDVQRHFRLSQSLAALQHGGAAKRPGGKKRGRAQIR